MEDRFLQVRISYWCHAMIVFAIFLTGCSGPVQFQVADPSDPRLMSGQQKTETFTQGIESKKLDILFIVDNSGSMAEEQEKLGERIDSFLSTLTDIDWQIGITTTDVSNGRFGLKGDLLPFQGTGSRVLRHTTPNYQQIFKSTIVRQETIRCGSDCPSGDEQALRAATLAIEKRDSVNRGFFRQDADLGLMVLSDEDEMSDGPAHATPPEAVLAAVSSAWGDSKQVLTYGMVIAPGDASCMQMQPGGGHYGTFVSRLANLTHGLVGSICAADYAPTLGLLANHARRLMEYVQLKYQPASRDNLRVTFLPDHTTDLSLEGRRVRFATPPPKGTLIQIDYLVK
jgi:hypothetical protein